MGIVQPWVHKLLPVDLRFLHVVLELPLSWSRKELHPACGNSTCCPDEEEEEDIAASQNPLAIAVAPHDALHKEHSQ
jgi:hypothetical protein